MKHERETAIADFWAHAPNATVGECDRFIAAQFGTSQPAARAARLRMYRDDPDKPWEGRPAISQRQRDLATRLRARMDLTRADVAQVSRKAKVKAEDIEAILHDEPFTRGRDLAEIVELFRRLDGYLVELDPFGATLTMVREAAGLTQQEAADSIGTSVFSLSKWERGDRRPRSDKTLALWQLYSPHFDQPLKLEWLLRGDVEAVREFCEAGAS